MPPGPPVWCSSSSCLICLLGLSNSYLRPLRPFFLGHRGADLASSALLTQALKQLCQAVRPLHSHPVGLGQPAPICLLTYMLTSHTTQPDQSAGVANRIHWLLLPQTHGPQMRYPHRRPRSCWKSWRCIPKTACMRAGPSTWQTWRRAAQACSLQGMIIDEAASKQVSINMTISGADEDVRTKHTGTPPFRHGERCASTPCKVRRGAAKLTGQAC
eukprot:1156492-Pelagomonas_calceolata.AAC.6